MILSQDIKKDQHYQRLRLKSAEAAFSGQIVKGTNCSTFEAEIIVDKAKEVFGPKSNTDRKWLMDGQMVFVAVSEYSASGVPMQECDKKHIILSHLKRQDDVKVLQEHGASAMRRQQMVRMCEEAREQGALLTQEDLGLLLDCNVRTIRNDIAKLRQQGISVATRGTIRDIGPGISHKHRAVDMWLNGKEATEVARYLSHSLSSVERYIQTFCRVVYAQRKLKRMVNTALVVGISQRLAKSYWDLYKQLVKDNSFYRERLEEALEIGQEYWQGFEVKKSPSITGDSS